MHYISGSPNNIVADSHAWADAPGETSGGGGAGGQYAVDAQSSGSVTATLTWVPAAGQADPAPKCVIVQETASASAQGASSSSDGLTASDGLGDAPQSQVGGLSSRGTRYSVKDGASGTVTLPAVSLSASTPPYTLPLHGGAAAAGVSYSVQAYPVTLGLSGTTKVDNDYNILIGQGCSGSLSVDSSISLSSYHWNVPGQTFASFQVASDLSSGYSVDVAATEWTLPSPHWYWRKDETVTVSCTADARVNGQFIGSVTGERQIKIWPPWYYFGPTTGQVTVKVTGYTSAIGAFADEHSELGGCVWYGRVKTPNIFGGLDWGEWHFIQITSPYRSYTKFGHTFNWDLNGQTGLDRWYPYAAPSINPLPWTAEPAADPDEGILHFTWDIPQNTLTDEILGFQANDSFSIYMMYLPPGDAQWVPLHLFKWHWNADAVRPGNSWLGWPQGQSAGQVQGDSSDRCTEHPSWSQLIIGNNVWH